MSKRKRNDFDLELKATIVSRLEKGGKNGNLAIEYGLSHSTISTIWKHREKIKTLLEENKSSNLKRARVSKHQDIEEALLKWFKQQRSLSIPISGPILQVKANDFGKLLGKNDFNCSNAWIQRFCQRHNIVSSRVCGESAGVSKEECKEWLSKIWPTLCAGYTPDEIFNADELGLFFNMLPDRTYAFKGEKCSSGKKSKVRLTVSVCANMSGTSKKKNYL